MRFSFRRKSESTPSSAPPEGFWDEWTRLADQPLSEVSDPVEGRLLVVRKLGAPHVHNDLPEMLRLIAEGTRQFPQEPVLRLAQILNGRGEREAARGVLGAGWKHQQRAVRRSQRAAEKAQYFSLVDFE